MSKETLSERHAQALKDVETLNLVCGDVHDYCGAWCNNDVLNSMLKNPSKKNAIHHLETLIDRYFTIGAGCDDSNASNAIDTEHPEVRKIGIRYDLF